MGLDVEIHVFAPPDFDVRSAVRRANARVDDYGIRPDLRFPPDVYNRFRATDYGAEFPTLWRYWGPGYERGPWFDIFGVLMTAVWAFEGCSIRYGADNRLPDEQEEWTPERTVDFWRHYCSDEGNSYRGGDVPVGSPAELEA